MILYWNTKRLIIFLEKNSNFVVISTLDMYYNKKLSKKSWILVSFPSKQNKLFTNILNLKFMSNYFNLCLLTKALSQENQHYFTGKSFSFVIIIISDKFVQENICSKIKV